MDNRFLLPVALLTLLFGYLPGNPLTAQQNWRDIRGGLSGEVTTVAVTGDGTILHGSWGAGILQSTDGGQSWWRGRFNNGPLEPAMTLSINSVAPSESGGEILASMSSTIFRSTDNGATWTRHITGLSEPFHNVGISSVIRLDANHVLIGTLYSFYRSTSDLEGYERIIPSDTAGMASQFLRSGEYIYAGTNIGVYRFRSDGTLDAAGLNKGLHARAQVSALATTTQGALLAGTDDGIYSSTDNGATWNGRQLQGHVTRTLLVSPDGSILAGTRDGMFRSTDNGITWSSSGSGLTSNWITSLARTPDGRIVAGTGSGIHISSDGAASWRSVHSGLVSTITESILATDSATVFVVQQGGAFPRMLRSTNAGTTWSLLADGKTGPGLVYMVPGPAGSIVAGTRQGVYRSNDNGETWQHLGLDSTVPRVAVGPDGRILASKWTSKTLHLSTDNGQTWRIVKDWDQFDEIRISPEGDLYAGSSFGLWRSSDNGANWDKMLITGSWIGALEIDRKGYVYVGTDLAISRSTDRGATWTKLDKGPLDILIGGLVASPFGHIYATLDFGNRAGVHRSTDNGVTWEQLPHEYGYISMPELSIDAAGYLYGNVSTGGHKYVMRSERAMAPGIRRPISPGDGATVAPSGLDLRWDPVAGASAYHVQLSSDPVFGQRTSGGTGSLLSAMLTVDDSSLTTPDRHVDGLATGTTYHWRVRSRIGSAWDLWSPMFTFTTSGPSAVDRESTAGRVAVAAISLPEPHPVSGRATIAFTLPHSGHVVLTLRDLLGREVRRLADGWFGAGGHVAVLETSGLQSGAYLLTVAGTAGGASRVVMVH